MSTKADVPDHPGLMTHALIERDAELLITDPDRMAMAHEIGGRDHEREAFRQADRILYLNPRTARGDIAHRAVSAAATAERKRALFENSVSLCCSPLNHGPVSETKRDAVHSAAKLRTIKFNSGCACTAVQISFTTMGGDTCWRGFPGITRIFRASCANGDHHEDDRFYSVSCTRLAAVRSSSGRSRSNKTLTAARSI